MRRVLRPRLRQENCRLGEGLQSLQRTGPRHLLVPQLMPYLYSSLKIGFALGWKIALIGEVFGVTIGVRREFAYWFQTFRLDMMLGWAVAFMTLMAVTEIVAFRRLDRVVYG